MTSRMFLIRIPLPDASACWDDARDWDMRERSCVTKQLMPGTLLRHLKSAAWSFLLLVKEFFDPAPIDSQWSGIVVQTRVLMSWADTGLGTLMSKVAAETLFLNGSKANMAWESSFWLGLDFNVDKICVGDEMSGLDSPVGVGSLVSEPASLNFCSRGVKPGS